MNSFYSNLLINRKRKNSLTMFFDYCSEGVWGFKSYYRFKRLPKPLQKEILQWINDTQATYYWYENNKYKLKQIDIDGIKLSLKLKKTLNKYKVIFQKENGSKYLILNKNKIIKLTKSY